MAAILLAASHPGWGQGEDSRPADRDLAVIATLLGGGFDNANQAYFDRRGDREVKHRRLHVDLNRVEIPALGDPAFVASAYWDNDTRVDAGDQLWVLGTRPDAVDTVDMQVYALQRGAGTGRRLDRASLNDKPSCSMVWRREAAQFRAAARGDCDAPLPAEVVLSDRQLWISYAGNGGTGRSTFRLHRVRDFECYADIPGVGGGRDEPYDRYDGFRTHDQGGQVWFTSKEGRRLGISLLNVDWPINNYDGVFTRDSFVIYVSEETDEGQSELGYAFTVPQADRIGINLKWMLASCYMKSNRFETPSM